MKVIIAGGGTGGHVYPGIAIAEMLVERKYCSKQEIYCNALIFSPTSGQKISFSLLLKVNNLNK